MGTIFYFEWRRKKNDIFFHLFWPAVVSLVLFAACLLAGRIPAFSASRFRWPEPLRAFLCLNSWNSSLWVNVVQLFTLIYSFSLPYSVMRGVARSVSEEDYYETIVYLHNAGIKPKTIFTVKSLFWLGAALACCVLTATVQAVLTILAASASEAGAILIFYRNLFLLCVFYLPVALLPAAFSRKAGMAGSGIGSILLIPMLLSRLPQGLCSLAEALTLAQREGAIIGKLSQIGNRLEILSGISPLTWTWPAAEIHGLSIGCACLVCLVLACVSFMRYLHSAP